MRIRLSASFNEAPFKAWFYFEHATVSTISLLKSELCAQLPLLQDAHLQPDDIQLLLDDFELLDISPVEVLRESDLVYISQKPSVALGEKRKVDLDDSDTLPRKRNKPQTNTVSIPSKPTTSVTLKRPLSSSESESDSDTDEDTSEDTSDSNSSEDSTDSDDSSDSDTSSSSGSSSPQTQPIIKTRALPNPTQNVKSTTLAKGPIVIQPNKPKGPSPAVFTPPGYGKPQTIKRNERRRRKRQYERNAENQNPSETVPLSGLSSINAMPLGTRSLAPAAFVAPSTAATTSTAVMPTDPLSTSMMQALSNKNKRRGFKAAPTVLPAKIVFPTSDQPDTTPRATGAVALSVPMSISTMATGEQVSALVSTRLIPPSELQERGQLPPRMFVTSVDVEEGMWPTHGKKSKGKKKINSAAYEQQLDEEDDSKRWDELEVEAEVTLDYGEDDSLLYVDADRSVPVAAQEHDEGSTNLDWDGVEQRWSTLPLVQDKTSLHIGVLVGWKALAINPATFTPEMMLHAARITKLEGETITIRPLFRPEAASVAFGGAIDDVDESMVGGEGEEEPVPVASAIAAEWRLI